MKIFNANPAALPEQVIDESRGRSFSENVLHFPREGAAIKIAAAGIPYSKEYYEAVSHGLQREKPKEHKPTAPKETKPAVLPKETKSETLQNEASHDDQAEAQS